MQDIRGSLRRQSLLVALVCVVCDAALFVLRGPLGEAGWRAWAVLLAGVAANAALAGAARYSGWVALAHAVLYASAPVLLCTCQGYVTGNNAGILIAGYRAGAWLRTRPAVLALGALLAGVAVGCIEGGGRTAADWRLIVINVSVSALLPWLVGRYTTARRAYIADLEREADERRQQQEEAVKRAVLEERTTIARDLHDVISHHVSAIGVHAGAARLGLPEGAEPARKSLGAVESASRSAMADLRRLLDLLHAETNVEQPGLDNLGELVETVRAAGLPTRLTLRGEPRELPGSLDIALYRIAQEALTNALRHGEGPVEVELNLGRTEVVLVVTNGLRENRTAENEHAHRGLAGIRRRVTLFGGQVSYGETGGLWQLRTTFPVEST
ncbi:MULTISPECIES: sensor histidine kinase [Amycolatopsis]|uniref:histidine kinase n=1 Tax=Amycolatopsis bullii TaxID=941987 RepID=A0ABQ3KMP3_9PSEU|nr:histidine kinase [Amycolatopsis bullii]GHG38794.1 two-component sensor histidine kinase [Amycolatopsis bullii]